MLFHDRSWEESQLINWRHQSYACNRHLTAGADKRGGGGAPPGALREGPDMGGTIWLNNCQNSHTKNRLKYIKITLKVDLLFKYCSGPHRIYSEWGHKFTLIFCLPPPSEKSCIRACLTGNINCHCHKNEHLSIVSPVSWRYLLSSVLCSPFLSILNLFRMTAQTLASPIICM